MYGNLKQGGSHKIRTLPKPSSSSSSISSLSSPSQRSTPPSLLTTRRNRKNNIHNTATRNQYRHFCCTNIAIRNLILFLVFTTTTPLSLGMQKGGPVTTTTTTSKAIPITAVGQHQGIISSPLPSIETVSNELTQPSQPETLQPAHVLDTNNNNSSSSNNNNESSNHNTFNNRALNNTVSYEDLHPHTTTIIETKTSELDPLDTTDISKSQNNGTTSDHQPPVVRLPPKKEVGGDDDAEEQKDKIMPSSSGGGEAQSVYSEEDRKFLDRVRASVKTVQNWDNSTALYLECRSIIPWDDLKNATGPYSRPDHDWVFHDNPDALFLQRLCRWFQTFMSWVNSPPCRVCGSTECEMKTVRGPITDEEKYGEAKRVEVYYCPNCKENTTTFPRYNRASKLLETRKGRCGEYSNLFGLFCRSVGYETRLVLDLSDHLWTEVRLPNGRDETWVMADACEGVIDKQSMYEHGWGKDSLCYMIGIGHDHVVDVTPRYTRKYLSDDFQSRRRQHTSSEDTSKELLKLVNIEIEKNKTATGLPPISKSRKEELERRGKLEKAELQNLKQRTEWTEQEKYGRGRMSGSINWRRGRGEIQDSSPDSSETPQDVAGFEVEAFVPSSQYSENGKVVFRLQPHPSTRYGGIEVSGTPCAIGETNSISVVVVDEVYLGTILQSKSFVSWSELTKFIDTLPSFRIVLMNGKIDDGKNKTDAEISYKDIAIDQLGGWDGSNVARNGVLYAGQVDAHPDWTFCSSIGEHENNSGYELELSQVRDRVSLPALSLRSERASVPQRVTGRIPDTFMPLSRQLQASDEEKRSTYLAFIGKSRNRHRYSGYTTKKNCPIYLLNSTAYPIQHVEASTIDALGRENVWNTFLSLPPALVPECDQGIIPSKRPNHPAIDVPVDVSFFKNSLGPTLLAGSTRLPTEHMLSHVRLVGIYFSASWCGPCRQFTPILAEFYSHLSHVNPTNGFEIIFVSSDRDLSSFENYYASHPWKAIPFDHLQLVRQVLSMTHNVRGIPSLVILDAVSGKVVVPTSQSRQEVQSACHRGQQGMEDLFDSWLDSVPSETQELIKMLELSVDEDSATNHGHDFEDQPYLRRRISNTDKQSNDCRSNTTNDDLAAEQNPNSAAAITLSLASGGSSAEGVRSTLPAGNLDGRAAYKGPPRFEDPVDIALVQALDWNPTSSVTTVLRTALKYLNNVIDEPWEPRYRTFRLSNKVADSVTSVEGGLGLLQALGFEVVVTSHDFKATIPVPSDLTAMKQRIAQLLDDVSS